MDRQAVARECERIEERGGDVLGYLRARGCVSPWGTWYRLQKEELHRRGQQITDGKGVEKLGKVKLTLADKKEAVRIATEGGNPYNFLREKGIAFPETCWHKIKNGITDPEILAKIPTRLPQQNRKKVPKAVKAAEPRTVIAEEPAEMTQDAKECTEAPERAAITKPLMFDGFPVREVEGKFGRYRYNKSNGNEYIDMENRDGLDVLSLTTDEWREFFDEAKRAALVLGVEL